MQPGSFLVSDVVMCSPRSIVPWADRIEENWWSLEKQFLHTLQRSERDLEIPHRSWQTDGNLACGWERATSQTSTLSERTMELENSWSEENLKSVIETPQKPRSTTTDDTADPRAVPEVHEHENQDEEANDNDGEDEESLDKPDDEDHDMEGETLPEPDTTATSSSSRAKKRTETQENVFVKRRLMTKSPKRPITLVPPPEDPVKRRLMKKTDLRNDESVMNIDVNLFDVMHTLTKDETVQETKHDEDNEMPKLTVLHGRQKKLKCLKEMGAMTVGKRAIQTRWVDREKDGRLKSRLVLKDHNRCQERTQPEMFSPTPSTLSLKNDAGCELTRQKQRSRIRPHHNCN